ncbi:hydrogenase expression/formation protein [Celeribacter neptunius]|uniref:Hydrogenase-1 operon protein HyaF n=1 Tax=Celeribacter neptunius TaxID=588602 RepID=A0A1I3NJV2_9RHOB|nr:hydrogenase expression/formation protein [Celeribacter neptunius]SFJ09447.1 hydrogenase-1 operon protein HyaF [Celeribacter neptunius]
MSDVNGKSGDKFGGKFGGKSDDRFNDGLELKDFMPKPGQGAEAAPEPDLPETGNVVLLLNEIRHALQRLIDTGEPTTLDLSGIPMTKAETEEFDRALGEGEVRVSLDAGGPSEIIETGFAGVWRVTHRAASDASGDMVLARYIEITVIPEILLSQRPDMQRALTRLKARLELSSEEEAL